MNLGEGLSSEDQPQGSRNPGSSHLDDHGQEFPIRLQFQHDQRGSQVLLATQDDISLDSIQQGEVSFKQRASLDGSRGQGLSASGIFFPP